MGFTEKILKDLNLEHFDISEEVKKSFSLELFDISEEVKKSFNSENKSFAIDLRKSEVKKGILRGTFSKAGVVDRENEIITNEALEESAHEYVLNLEKGISHFRGGLPNTTHEVRAKARLLESYIDKSEKDWAWKGAVKIDDPRIRRAIENDEIDGFSIGGYKLVKEI